MSEIPQTDQDLLDIYGIKNATTESEKDKDRYAARAVNGHSEDAWVPVTNVSLIRGVIPNMSLTAWMEVSDTPGEYMSIITLFRTNKGLLECFVPCNTKYYVGIGLIPPTN